MQAPSGIHMELLKRNKYNKGNCRIILHKSNILKCVLCENVYKCSLQKKKTTDGLGITSAVTSALICLHLKTATVVKKG